MKFLAVFLCAFLLFPGFGYSANSPESRIKVYVPARGIQQDDSVFISQNNLNYITKFVSGCDGKANPWSFVLKGVYDENEGAVFIESNKPLCVADTLAIKQYLDDSIKENQRKNAERGEREMEMNARDPKRPYALGCEAYKATVRGVGDIPTIEIARNLYPKINPIYVANLWRQGYQHASSYGMRNVDCAYLAAVAGL
ncbi:hypothetical protein RZZ01_004523 [Salmonella enterica]|nr:hypothetical protein [Salmonella enterica]